MQQLAVIDTNIFIGACLGVGAANLVIAGALEGRYVPAMGAALYHEYEDVLSRDSLFADSRLNQSERHELFDIFLNTCLWTQVYFGWRPNLPDEADNHLVELAVASGASFIVTKNLKHLQRMELAFANLAVVSPQDFLKEIAP
jgi:predicted nucleic acid-binding protein